MILLRDWDGKCSYHLMMRPYTSLNHKPHPFNKNIFNKNKMELIQTIRNEIERRTYGEQGFNSEDAEYGYRSCARELLSFLDTLESEKPMNQEGIDTEIGHWMDRLDDKYCLLVPHYSIQDIKDTARHFAKWGAEHSDSSEIPKDLEEAAENYSKERAEGHILYDWVHAFIAGAKWDRSQMLKEAVDTVVSLDAGGFPFIEFGVGKFGLKVGDKVRVIVLQKED